MGSSQLLLALYISQEVILHNSPNLFSNCVLFDYFLFLTVGPNVTMNSSGHYSDHHSATEPRSLRESWRWGTGNFSGTSFHKMTCNGVGWFWPNGKWDGGSKKNGRCWVCSTVDLRQWYSPFLERSEWAGVVVILRKGPTRPRGKDGSLPGPDVKYKNGPEAAFSCKWGSRGRVRGNPPMGYGLRTPQAGWSRAEGNLVLPTCKTLAETSKNWWRDSEAGTWVPPVM